MSETPNQPQTEALEVVLLNKLIEVCSVWRQDGQLKISVTMLQGDLSKGSRYKKQYAKYRNATRGQHNNFGTTSC